MASPKANVLCANPRTTNNAVEEDHVGIAPEVSSPKRQQRREKILAIAQKEEEDYKKYKESKKLHNVNESPSATGGEVSREEVIMRYEKQIKSEKFRAKVKKDTYKEEQKKIEEDKINAKKIAARRQADKNALIERQRLEEQAVNNLDEMRRNRMKYFGKVNTSKDEAAKEVCYSSSNMSPSGNYDVRKKLDVETSSSRERNRISGETKTHLPEDSYDQQPADEIITLIGMFPDMDIQLLHDVYTSHGNDLQQTISFFQ